MWAVSGVGRLWVRQARERVLWVVGTRAIKSYPTKRDAFALIYEYVLVNIYESLIL